MNEVNAKCDNMRSKLEMNIRKALLYMHKSQFKKFKVNWLF
jgi:hypothetical protein